MASNYKFFFGTNHHWSSSPRIYILSVVVRECCFWFKFREVCGKFCPCVDSHHFCQVRKAVNKLKSMKSASIEWNLDEFVVVLHSFRQLLSHPNLSWILTVCMLYMRPLLRKFEYFLAINLRKGAFCVVDQSLLVKHLSASFIKPRYRCWLQLLFSVQVPKIVDSIMQTSYRFQLERLFPTRTTRFGKGTTWDCCNKTMNSPFTTTQFLQIF